MKKRDIHEHDPEYLEDNEYSDNYDEDEYDYESVSGLSFGARFTGVIICLGLLAGLLYYGFFLYNSMLEPVNPKNDTPHIITIEEGMLPKDVAQLLKDNDLIKNSLVFQSYVGRHSYGGAEIIAATYELNQAMPVSEIYTKLVKGDSYIGPLNSLTIPEGYNLNEIAQAVQDAGICSAEEYIAEASNVEKYIELYPILDSIPVEKRPDRTLEGYLFPATYMINNDGTSSAQSLIEDQLAKFTEEYNPELLQKTAEAGRTVDDIVILASIVELETKLPEDRPVAASVFYNRMAQNMPLQSDITIDYIYGTRTEILTTEQTQVESPYNTYINLGLPFGPIDNPGIDSIIAAIEPAQTDYLYFVADLETGKLHFNTTLEGHDQDVATYLN